MCAGVRAHERERQGARERERKRGREEEKARKKERERERERERETESEGEKDRGRERRPKTGHIADVYEQIKIKKRGALARVEQPHPRLCTAFPPIT